LSFSVSKFKNQYSNFLSHGDWGLLLLFVLIYDAIFHKQYRINFHLKMTIHNFVQEF